MRWSKARGDRIQKKEVIRRLSQRLETDEKTATACLDAVVEVLYEAIREGESITLPGFGSFFVRPSSSTWTFKFNPAQRLRALLGWSSTYKGPL